MAPSTRQCAMHTQKKVLASILLAVLSVGAAFAQSNPDTVQGVLPDQLVKGLNGVFGKHTGARAVHAKGIVLDGSFQPAAGAAALSKAPHFAGAGVPVRVRFSNFAGIPTVADNDAGANPRGLAVKFYLPDGTATDIVAHSFDGFPSATSADFRDLLIAIGQSGPDAAKPTALETYFGTHPKAKAFLTAPKPMPESYATLPYYGVNAFKFTNAKGKAVYGRYQFVPVASSHFLSKEQEAAAGPQFLIDEIGQRTRKAPVQFKLMLQLAERGDDLHDPSVA